MSNKKPSHFLNGMIFGELCLLLMLFIGEWYGLLITFIVMIVGAVAYSVFVELE